MNEIMLFENTALGAKIRKVTGPDGEPWFVANDVCEFLGYVNSRDVLQRIKDLDYVAQSDVLDSRGLSRSTNIISEAGLYMLVFGSSKPEALQFNRWVTSEVLPSIRKRGGYISSSATAEQITTLVERHVALFGHLGGADERDKIFYKDLLRSQLVSAAGSAVPRREWTISDRVAVVTGRVPNKRDVMALGKRAAAAYRVKHGHNPPKREQYVDGAPRQVFCYYDEDLPMLDKVIREYYEK